LLAFLIRLPLRFPADWLLPGQIPANSTNDLGRETASCRRQSQPEYWPPATSLDRINEELVDLFEPRTASSYCVFFFGWMQSAGQASTEAVTLVPIQRSAIVDATIPILLSAVPPQSTRATYLYLVGRGPSSSICRSQIPPSRV
jgi:hypothetical protein